MFNELVESVAVRRATNKRWGFIVSLTLQSACLLALVIIPLIYTQALPKPVMDTFLVAPTAPAPAPPAPPKTAIEPMERSPRLISHGVITEPRAFPPHPQVFAEAPLPPESGAAFGGMGGVDVDLLQGLANNSTPQRVPSVPIAPAPATAPVQPQRIQKGGEIQAAQLISRVQPAYPVLAHQSGIQGVVVLHAIIDKDGRVSELHIISGHPLLVKAAMDAVSQWRYQPTLLNGQPVEVETTITVTFVLGG